MPCYRLHTQGDGGVMETSISLTSQMEADPWKVTYIMPWYGMTIACNLANGQWYVCDGQHGAQANLLPAGSLEITTDLGVL